MVRGAQKEGFEVEEATQDNVSETDPTAARYRGGSKDGRNNLEAPTPFQLEGVLTEK